METRMGEEGFECHKPKLWMGMVVAATLAVEHDGCLSVRPPPCFLRASSPKRRGHFQLGNGPCYSSSYEISIMGFRI